MAALSCCFSFVVQVAETFPYGICDRALCLVFKHNFITVDAVADVVPCHCLKETSCEKSLADEGSKQVEVSIMFEIAENDICIQKISFTYCSLTGSKIYIRELKRLAALQASDH